MLLETRLKRFYEVQTQEYQFTALHIYGLLYARLPQKIPFNCLAVCGCTVKA